jgi:dihydroflavonol-4-reductase
MKTFVTGATGFVGWHLAKVLVDRGDRVRCLARPGSIVDRLGELAVDVVPGDLRNLDSLRAGIDGVDVVYHCAADYRLYVPDPAAMYASNVDGTNNIMQAASDCGVQKVVYTSTVGALGLHSDGTPGNERSPVSLEKMTGHYKRSKFLAERAADDWAARGLPVVTVNPSAPIGERDVKPTATGQMIVDFMRGKMKAYVDTGLNLVDVRDVALGHVLASEKGRVGEKYILGHCNMTLKSILDELAKITGLPAPSVRLPHWIPLAAAYVDTGLARVMHRQPRIAVDAVRLSRYRMFFDSSKAVRELGLPQTPVEEPLRRAVEWYRQNGFVRRAAA